MYSLASHTTCLVLLVMVMSSASMHPYSRQQICKIALHHLFPDRCSGTDEAKRNIPFFWYPPENYETNKPCTEPHCDACYLMKINPDYVDCSFNPYTVDGKWTDPVQSDIMQNYYAYPDGLDCFYAHLWSSDRSIISERISQSEMCVVYRLEIEEHPWYRLKKFSYGPC
jgi:hypothetical protein